VTCDETNVWQVRSGGEGGDIEMWQARALDEFDSAVRVARRDGVT
jgi:hypothetical protein